MHRMCRQPSADVILTSSDDIITPRQQPRKHVHVSDKSWDDISGSAADPWPGPCIHWLWLFVLTFDQKSKFLKRHILLSFSCRFQFWTLFLHLRLQNWSTGILFIVVSSKAFFTTSPSDFLMLIQPQAFIELLPWVWGRVLEIYIRHISPM